MKSIPETRIVSLSPFERISLREKHRVGGGGRDREGGKPKEGPAGGYDGSRRRKVRGEREGGMKTGERGKTKEEERERVGTNRLGLSAILLAARTGQVSYSCPQKAWKRLSRLHRENEWLDVGVESRHEFSLPDRTWRSGVGWWDRH